MIQQGKITAFFITALFLAVPIFSHHYVLTPAKFIYEQGEIMQVHLMVGEIFDYEFERELQLNMTPRFQLYTSKGESNLMVNTTDSMIPVANRRVDFDGLGMLVMERCASMIEEKPGTFQNYLAEERVNGISFDSATWNKPVVKERYSRYLKSLVMAGSSGTEEFFKKPAGLKLELMLLKNPYHLQPGEDISIEVLFEGKPLAHALVGLSQQHDRNVPIETFEITDKEGRCHFNPLPDANCVLHCVYIKQLPPGHDTDFESYWASYSFKVLVSGN